MTDREPGQHDDELDTTFYPVSSIEGIAKAVIRAARADHRWIMWKAYSSAREDAAESSPDRMPWDPPETVTRLTARHARDVLTAMLEAVPDNAERNRLVPVITRACEQAEQRLEAGEPDSGAPAWMPKCGYCGQPCKHKTARYCTPSHRQQAYKKRKRGG